jgi:rRNA-processing protein FCF1
MAAHILIDTSSLVYGFANRKDAIDIAAKEFRNCKIEISRGILRELTGISNNKGKRGAAAKSALAAINFKRVVVNNDNTDVDSWLLGRAVSLGNGCIVITNDSELKEKLKANGIKSLRLSRDGSLR